MTTRNVILLVAVLALCACGGAEQQATPTGVDKQPWEAFAANTITEYYGRNPELAVSVGLHEYDGQMSDFSLAAAEEYASWIDGVIATAASYDDLEGIEAFERDYMVNALRGELFWIRDSGFAINNPVAYAFALDFDVYIDREYAPLEERIHGNGELHGKHGTGSFLGGRRRATAAPVYGRKFGGCARGQANRNLAGRAASLGDGRLCAG
jgi:hypothetical protein